MVESADGSIKKKCPLLFELDKGGSIGCYPKYGPVFQCSHEITIHDECNKEIDQESHHRNTNYIDQWSFNAPPKVNICGGDRKDASKRKYLFQVIDYEVFQIV